MNYDIGNLVNLSNNNGLSAPMCISFELKNGDHFIGTCQFTLENVFLHVELIDDRGNQFSFKPGRELEKEKESSSPETEINLNSPDLANSIKIEIEDEFFVNPFHSVNNKDAGFSS